jgi:NADH dehydrogenase
MEKDPERRRALLTFALVGGGPTGVEMAGSIAELAHRALNNDFRHIRPEEARILLLESSPTILNNFPDNLAAAAAKALERLGVEIRCGNKVEAVEAGAVVVGGERIRCSTVLWTAGVVIAIPLGTWLGVETDRSGRVKVGPDLLAPGHPDIYVIGDAAHAEQDGEQLPGVAPVAMQQGRYVAKAIRSRLASRPVEPFRYRDKGNLATVGRAFAILDMGRLKLSGFIAWLLWVGLHIWYLIGFRNKLSVFFQWAYAYFTWQRSARLITGPIPAPTIESVREE